MISGFHIYSSVPRFPRFELNFFGKIAVVSAYHFWFEAAVFSFHLCNEHIIFFVSYCWRPYCYHLFLLRYLISWQKISSFIFHIFKLCRWTIPGFIEPILTALPRFCVIVLVWRLCEIGLTNCYVCAFFCVNSCWHTKYHIYRTTSFLIWDLLIFLFFSFILLSEACDDSRCYFAPASWWWSNCCSGCLVYWRIAWNDKPLWSSWRIEWCSQKMCYYSYVKWVWSMYLICLWLFSFLCVHSIFTF